MNKLKFRSIKNYPKIAAHIFYNYNYNLYKICIIFYSCLLSYDGTRQPCNIGRNEKFNFLLGELLTAPPDQIQFKIIFFECSVEL